VAGSVMASLSTVVILGIRNPFVVLLTSSIALVSGILPVELIDTFWENNSGSTAKFNNIKRIWVRFFIYYLELITGFQDVK
jgi:hypothetical protein